MEQIRLDNQVAIVTGAGGGLGRAHALLLARRGAQVVVNDLGTSGSGSGADATSAEKVVEEIRAAGGQAVASNDSVVDGDKIVAKAVEAFGRVDIVVNNAGFLRDVSFHKMTVADWEDLYRVHLFGSFRVAHAAWPLMREQGYGRVVNTASSAGIYGNFGQANYASVKLALHGLTQSLAIEGKSKNILANTIAPAADSRLTRTVMTPDQLKAMQPELVSPLVAYLCSKQSTETGGLFEVGGGWVGKLRWERSAGAWAEKGREQEPEEIARNWRKITDFSDAAHPASMEQAFEPFQKVMGAAA